jgi:hypothetical protein
MGKRLTIPVLVRLGGFLILLPIAPGFAAEKGRQILLRDGFALRGVEGKLIRQDANETSQRECIGLLAGQDAWFFEFDSPVKSYRGSLKAGTKLRMLPSATLEQMIYDVNDRTVPRYRLRATVTRYKGKNFIFPTYFLPLSGARGPGVTIRPGGPDAATTEASQGSQKQEGPTTDDPNDEFAVPKEIIQMRKAKRTTPGRQLERQQAVAERRKTTKHNYILANRTGFIRESNRKLNLVLDALGLNVQSAGGGLRLLPCQALELAEREQSAEPDPIRFKMAGIVTEYKGDKYLLLQRATRTYSHGNFDH